MNKKIVLIIVAGFLSSPQIIAQERGENPTNKDAKTDWSEKFFMALSTSTYTDFLVSPLKYYKQATGNFDPSGNPTFAQIPYQSAQYNIISIGFEPRLNLKEFDENASLSASAPISFGIGSSMSAAGEELIVKGVEGFGSIQIPLFLKLNIGNGSTYTTQKDNGFSIGAGMELNKLGLINLTSLSKQYNKAFVIPSLSAGVIVMRGDSPMEINFKYSFGKLMKQETDSQGDLLKDNTGTAYIRITRAQTIKLTLVYLLNY